MQQEDHSCSALVDELAEALHQNDANWQQKADALRQRADALESADRYDAHMEMGTLLTARYTTALLTLCHTQQQA